jgi:hypothetical protein
MLNGERIDPDIAVPEYTQYGPDATGRIPVGVVGTHGLQICVYCEVDATGVPNVSVRVRGPYTGTGVVHLEETVPGYLLLPQPPLAPAADPWRIASEHTCDSRFLAYLAGFPCGADHDLVEAAFNQGAADRAYLDARAAGRQLRRSRFRQTYVEGQEACAVVLADGTGRGPYCLASRREFASLCRQTTGGSTVVCGIVLCNEISVKPYCWGAQLTKVPKFHELRDA